MLPITSKDINPRKRENAHFADGRLRSALAGESFIVIDGAMGSMLQARGIKAADTVPEMLCLDDPQIISDIHKSYVESGAEIVTTNTFGANSRKLAGKASVEEVFDAAIACAREARAPYIAADIGPLGALLEPMGDLRFEDAYELFSAQARAAVQAGCDLFIIETMADLLEMKAAILAVKENSELPIIATMTFDENGRTMMGTTPQIAAIALDALGVNSLGINCSVGPELIAEYIAQMAEHTPLALVAQPNAGLPKVLDGETVYEIDVEAFIRADSKVIEAGASVLGSCCGTTPAYTEAIARKIKDKVPSKRDLSRSVWATSARQAVDVEKLDLTEDVLCLNPDGENDPLDIADAVFDAEDELVLKLDVDPLDLEDIPKLVSEIQSMSALPLFFSGDASEKIEAAARSYSGVPLIASTSSAALELLRLHYGCAVLP